MKALPAQACFVFALFALAAPAAESFQIPLEMKLEYQDALGSCRDLGFITPFLFVGTFAEGRLATAELRAQLNAYYREGPFERRYPEHSRMRWRKLPFQNDPILTLRPDELANSAFTRSEGRVWFERLRLPARALVWMLHPVETGVGCKPKRPLSAVRPEALELSFELEGVRAGIPVSYSPPVRLQAYRWNGSGFAVARKTIMQLRQILPQVMCFYAGDPRFQRNRGR